MAGGITCRIAASKPVNIIIKQLFFFFFHLLQITEDFLAAYQANYGFTEEGGQAANNAPTEGSTDSAASEAKKPSDKEKQGGGVQDVDPSQQESSVKDLKQKGEKRKPEPGLVPKHTM